MLLPDNEGKHDIGHVKATKAPEGATTGATTGGITGGVLGLLAGIGALAIPGVGPFIAAGPIMAALSGAAIGAATGGVMALNRNGYSRNRSEALRGKLKTGNYLIAVHPRMAMSEGSREERFSSNAGAGRHLDFLHVQGPTEA